MKITKEENQKQEYRITEHWSIYGSGHLLPVVTISALFFFPFPPQPGKKALRLGAKEHRTTTDHHTVPTAMPSLKPAQNIVQGEK